MKIDSLHVQNFRGIKNAKIENLGQMVIVAGQNGSGKSCLFDAIRLLKSVYGGYQQNEWQNWLGEFSIPGNANAETLATMFNDPSRQISIKAVFRLAEEEKEYLTANAQSVLTDYVWRTVLPEAFQYGSYRFALFAAQFREREPEVLSKVAELTEPFLKELRNEVLEAVAIVPPGESIALKTSHVLSVAFTLYRPQDIGVIDYHGAQRHYGREFVQAVNISLDEEAANKQHSLYNSAGKYNNVKSELAASYVKEVFVKEAGGNPRFESLTRTLQELFETFFPDKRFIGPTPTKAGHLSFPVRTPGGTHDLDDLSAGEKEILYGYLRIRNSAPKHSIILLDEPELHLNPRLIRNLPEFYRQHLGDALGNQIWLVSHSDALLREAFGKPAFDLYHMQPCSTTAGDGTLVAPYSVNQLKPLVGMRDVDVLLAELIGDLASYEPGRRAVIFEGGGDTDFDQSMVATLFPELAKTHNLVSGTSKAKVRALHQVLDRAYDKGDLKTKFFAIVDRDFEEESASRAVDVFHWDVYHIENYLLNAEIIAEVEAAATGSSVRSSDDVMDALRNAARNCVDAVVRERLLHHANREFVRAIDLKGDPASEDYASRIVEAADRSLAKLTEVRRNTVSVEGLRAFEEALRSDIEASFADGTWRERLPGRNILNRYVDGLKGPLNYKTLRNLIVSKMKDRGIQPEGMKTVISAILAA